MTDTALLVLENGRVFRGRSYGYPGETAGEVCFNTGMTGYQEVLTDPSYHAQIVCMTYPQIGNYGVNPEDVESGGIQVAGFVVREGCAHPSNYRSVGTLDGYLHDHHITGIQDIDTRALTRLLRTEGAMNGIISCIEHDPAALLARLRDVPSMTGLDLARSVTCAAPYDWTAGAPADLPGNAVGRGGPWRVAALDFGIKYGILRQLTAHGCDVTVHPATTPAGDILATRPDGIFLSNGPGDPGAVGYGIETVRALTGRLPVFGICLGHQILALALGARTYKLKFGHRGANHPVHNDLTGRVEITSQNHGFAVDAATLPAEAEPTHWNLNDGTLEGFRAPGLRAFSVQYHPEAGPGPHDARYLFRAFTDLMEAHAPTQ
jgi:carbamoyl-phosphate synthase small subunit